MYHLKYKHLKFKMFFFRPVCNITKTLIYLKHNTILFRVINYMLRLVPTLSLGCAKIHKDKTQNCNKCNSRCINRSKILKSLSAFKQLLIFSTDLCIQPDGRFVSSRVLQLNTLKNINLCWTEVYGHVKIILIIYKY